MRTSCCPLPPGVKLQQSDEFTLAGNPYPNQNQLAMLGRIQTAVANRRDGDTYNQAACGATGVPSYETMNRLYMSAKVMQCPTGDCPRAQQYYH